MRLSRLHFAILTFCLVSASACQPFIPHHIDADFNMSASKMPHRDAHAGTAAELPLSPVAEMAHACSVAHDDILGLTRANWHVQFAAVNNSQSGSNMQSPYIPTQDTLVLGWAQNFRDVIVANPSTFFLSGGDATDITNAVAPFEASMALVLAPATRTAPVVADKNANLAFMLGVCRPYAVQIKNNIGISNTDKLAVGVNLINNARTPVPAPDSNPLLSVIGATQGVHTIRFSDANAPDKRSKPFGAIALQLFVKIGDAPVTNPSESSFYASVTRQPFAVQFSPTDNGKNATYFGRWITRTGLVGPWSPPVNFGIVS